MTPAATALLHELEEGGALGEAEIAKLAKVGGWTGADAFGTGLLHWEPVHEVVSAGLARWQRFRDEWALVPTGQPAIPARSNERMIDITLSADITAVKVKTKEVDGQVTRKCQMALRREFDDLLAAGLGGDARKVLASLRERGIESCVIPLDAIDARGKLDSGYQAVTIGQLTGIKATAKAGEDDAPPTIVLEFEFAWQETAWLFLGRNCGLGCELELVQRQQELPGVTTKPALSEMAKDLVETFGVNGAKSLVADIRREKDKAEAAASAYLDKTGAAGKTVRRSPADVVKKKRPAAPAKRKSGAQYRKERREREAKAS